MHWLYSRMPVSSCCTSAGGNWWLALAGSRCWQSFCALSYWELLTPSCCALGNFESLDGSGKFGTPCERMHWEKASSEEFPDPPASDEPPESVDAGLPPHAAASKIRAAVAMRAVAVRAAGGHARRGRGWTRRVWFIMPSSGGWVIVLVAGMGTSFMRPVLRPDG